VAAVQLVAAEGAHHHDASGAEICCEEHDQVAGGAVGPVQVLHHPQQRRLGGQPLKQAEQPREQPPLTGERVTGDRGRLAAPGRVGQQPAQLGPGRAGDRLKLGRVQPVGQAPQGLEDRRERHALLA
jgi:hypothetical protein